MAPFFVERNAAKMALFSRSEKWRKIVLFAVRNAAKNGPVLGCELGRACFSRFFSRKWHFFRGAKCGEYGALLLAKNGENGALQKKIERKKLAKNGTFETKNRLSPT
jgi:hypothetical protein